MELNTIQTEGTWNEVAENINANFRKINLAIENGTGGGGEGGTVSEELLEQVADNTTNIGKNTDNIGTLKTRVDVLYANESTTGSVQNRIKKALEDYVAKEDGTGLSTEDFTTALKSKLEGLTNYDDTTISNAVNQLQGTLNTLLHSDPNEAINSFNEIIKFLEGVEDSESLDSIIASIEHQIADKYTKPSGGIPASDLETNVQASLQKADAAVQQNDIYSKTELDAKFDAKIDKNGGEIKGSLTHIMSSTGGDASGYEYKNASGERIAGFGAYANKGELIHTYIGFGSEPWGTYNGLNVGENVFTYKGKAIWYSGQEITESVKISTGSDNKIVLNNTDGDTKYSFILFMDKGEVYGRLGTNGTSELRWNNNVILDSNNYTDFVDEAIAREVTEQTRDFITRSDVKESYALKTDVDKKQAQLVSGENIATINGQSLLDGRNINIGNNGVTDVLEVSLNVSSFAVGEDFSITDAQLNTILQSRSGYTVVVKDGNNTSEWGQVIGCYFLNIGGGVTFYRITIMHHTNDPQATSGDMVMYNMDVMIQPGNSNHVCKVISIKTL